MKKDNVKFAKSMSILSIGSIISVVFLAIQHIALPYIFTPEEIGIKSVILAIPTACVGIVCGRYDLTLVYEKNEENVKPLLKLNLLLNLVVSTLITLVSLLYFLIIETSYIQYWYLLPAIWIYLFVYGLTLTLNSYNNRYRDYKTIAKMHAFRTAAQCLGTVVLGLIFVYFLKIRSLSVLILVVPYCVGMACGLWSQSKGVRQDGKEIISINSSKIKEVAKTHRNQPLLSAPAILANALSYSLITIMINWFFGEEITGYYSLSITLLGLPITLISSNLSKVYMKDAAKEYETNGNFKSSFKKNFLFLSFIAVPMFFLMYFAAPPICSWLFGSKWEIAGIYIKALALMFAFRFIATALSPGLFICGKQVAELFIQVSLLVATVIAGVLCAIFSFDAVGFLWLLCGLRSGVMLIHVLIVWYY